MKEAQTAVGADDAMVDFERLARLEGPADCPADRVAVVAMDERQVTFVRDRPFLRHEAEDPIRLVGPCDDVAGDVPFPAPDVGDGLGVAQEFDRVPAGGLGSPPTVARPPGGGRPPPRPGPAGPTP